MFHFWFDRHNCVETVRVSKIQRKLVLKLTVGPFLTLNVRNGPSVSLGRVDPQKYERRDIFLQFNHLLFISIFFFILYSQ